MTEEEGKTKLFQAALEEAKAILSSYPQLLSLLDSYALSREERHGLLDSLGRYPPFDLLCPFLKTLSDAHLMGRFADIATLFEALANKKEGVKEGVVSAAHPLSAEEVAMLAQSLSERLGAKVALSFSLDPSLLGGVRIAIDGQIIDGSLKARLDGLKAALTKKEGLNP